MSECNLCRVLGATCNGCTIATLRAENEAIYNALGCPTGDSAEVAAVIAQHIKTQNENAFLKSSNERLAQIVEATIAYFAFADDAGSWSDEMGGDGLRWRMSGKEAAEESRLRDRLSGLLDAQKKTKESHGG